jgi:hypothetical protein
MMFREARAAAAMVGRRALHPRVSGFGVIHDQEPAIRRVAFRAWLTVDVTTNL